MESDERKIYRLPRLKGGVCALADQDIEAFCSRGGDGTVVIGVSLSMSRYLKMNKRFH